MTATGPAGTPVPAHAWWRGTWLVARRGVLDTLRSRSFRVLAGIMFVASAASVAVPAFLSGRATTYTLATVGPAEADLRSALALAARDGSFAVRYDAMPDVRAVRTAVEDGRATAGLAGSTLYVSARRPGPFGAVVSQAVVSTLARRALTAAGLTPEQIEVVTSVRPPEQVDVAGGVDGGRLAVGFAVGVAVYIAISIAGASIATTVATEKSTQISEVLLAVLLPSQVLVGTVLAVGLVTLAQVVVLAAPLAVTSAFTDLVSLPSATGGDLAMGALWFVLGFGLYAFAYAAAAALVEKVTEVSAVTGAVSTVLLVGYAGAIYVSTQGASDGWSRLLSVFPLSAPLAMPVRWASGQVPTGDLLTAAALTAATVVLVVALASRFYARALVITGHRVRLGELRAPRRSEDA